MLNNKVFN